MYFGLELGLSIGIPLLVIIIAVILYFVHKRRQRFRPGLVDPIYGPAPQSVMAAESLMVFPGGVGWETDPIHPIQHPIPLVGVDNVPDYYESARDAAKNLRKTTPGNDLHPDYKTLEPIEKPEAYQRRKRSRPWKPSAADADSFRSVNYFDGEPWNGVWSERVNKMRPLRDDDMLDLFVTQVDMDRPADAPGPWSANAMNKRQAELVENARSAGPYYFG